MSIDFTKSEQYTLSIRLSTDGIEFSIYNPLYDNSLSVIEKEVDPSLSLTANIKKTFRECDFLEHRYKKVNILMANKRFTTVPLECFEDEQAPLLFYHNHLDKDYEVVLYNVQKQSNTVVIYAMDKSVHAFLSEQFPTVSFYAQSSVLIDYFCTKSKLGNSKKMFVLVQRKSINLYAFEKGHLLLANTFDCQQPEDKLYYILYVWKQLGFNQERDELHLSGMINDEKKLSTELRRYIEQLYITNSTTHVDLQALLACE